MQIPIKKVLKAQLYSILPTSDNRNPLPELKNLQKILNGMLEANCISVLVTLADPKEQSKFYYNQQKINQTFNEFDILQIDTINLWAVNQNLMIFSKDQLKFYDKLFPFQWQPIKRYIEGKEMFIGSPALLCSDFLNKREGTYEDQLYARISESLLVRLYLNYFINVKEGNTVQSADYRIIDEETIVHIAAFLKKLRKYQQQTNIFDTNAAYTLGFSEFLSYYQQNRYDMRSITIEHIAKDKPKKIFVVDALIAKDSNDIQDRQTILKFFEFMISDQVLDVYMHGKYMNNPHKTYIIPPTIKCFEDLAKNDQTYNQMLKIMKQSQLTPLFQPCYNQNIKEFYQILIKKLREMGIMI